MNENERIVCEFLREIAPSREWRYLGEVEHYLIGELCDELNKQLKAENAKLRELCAGLHMAYVETLNECESLDEGLIWEYSEMVDAELAKSHARFEADRHRFDVAMSELGIEVDA